MLTSECFIVQINMQVKTAAREMGQKAKREKLVKYCVSVLINSSLLLKNSYMFSCTSHIIG